MKITKQSSSGSEFSGEQLGSEARESAAAKRTWSRLKSKGLGEGSGSARSLRYLHALILLVKVSHSIEIERYFDITDFRRRSVTNARSKELAERGNIADHLEGICTGERHHQQGILARSPQLPFLAPIIIIIAGLDMDGLGLSLLINCDIGRQGHRSSRSKQL